MHKFSERLPDRASHSDSRSGLDVLFQQEPDSGLACALQEYTADNAELLDELKHGLRERSNEIRNTDSALDTPEKAELPSEKTEAETVPDKKEQGEPLPENEPERESSDENRTEPPASAGDRTRERFTRGVAGAEENEKYRTELVGMTETAASSARRMEYLERERGTKERAALGRAVNTLGGRSGQDGLFDFLLRRRADEEENPDEEDRND